VQGRAAGHGRAGPPVTRDLALFYLARHAEGLPAFHRFATSYRAHPPGYPHTLVIIYKGFDTEAGVQEARSVFADLPHGEIRVDDTQFDIGAYLHAAAHTDADYVCFVNTHTEILAPNWLAHLRAAMRDPSIGLAGPHASFESLRDSLALTCKAVWLAGIRPVPFDRQLANAFRFALKVQAPAWMEQRPVWRDWFPRGWQYYRYLDAEWQAFWQANSGPGGVYHFLDGFPHFPNPHIRSNGFIVERRMLLDLFPRIAPTKQASYGFESGPDSLPAQVIRSGRRLALVDRNGVVYDHDRWTASRTFRLGNQANIMLADNQTRAFDRFSPPERAVHVMMSWGEAMAWPRGYSLGFRFRMRR
jgi:hypothetical protein